MFKESESTIQELTENIAGKIKMQIRVLLLVSTLVVALAFGLSFYFSLISSEAAMVKQIPELEAVSGKMKSMLLVNTFAVILIIAASLYILSILITAKLFRPVGVAQRGLISLARGSFPRLSETGTGHGPFACFNKNMMQAVEKIKDKESSEIDELKKCLTLLSRKEFMEMGKKLEKLIREKETYLGDGSNENTGGEEKSAQQDIFMQPS